MLIMSEVKSMDVSFINRGFKVIILGCEKAGKSSFLRRLTTDTFQDEYKSTIGVVYQQYQVKVGSNNLKLDIWDTGGSDKFRAIARAYIKSAVAAVIVFDLTNPESLIDVRKWMTEIRDQADPNMFIFLLGNKSDIMEEKKITDSQIRDIIEEFEVECMLVSCKDGTNIHEASIALGRGIIDSTRRKKRRVVHRSSSEDIISSIDDFLLVEKEKRKKCPCCC